MDNERIKGMFDQTKGAVKVATGKATGDLRLQTEGNADKVKGKVENAIGGANDAVHDLRDFVNNGR